MACWVQTIITFTLMVSQYCAKNTKLAQHPVGFLQNPSSEDKPTTADVHPISLDCTTTEDENALRACSMCDTNYVIAYEEELIREMTISKELKDLVRNTLNDASKHFGIYLPLLITINKDEEEFCAAFTVNYFEKSLNETVTFLDPEYILPWENQLFPVQDTYVPRTIGLRRKVDTNSKQNIYNSCLATDFIIESQDGNYKVNLTDQFNLTFDSFTLNSVEKSIKFKGEISIGEKYRTPVDLTRQYCLCPADVEYAFQYTLEAAYGSIPFSLKEFLAQGFPYQTADIRAPKGIQSLDPFAVIRFEFQLQVISTVNIRIEYVDAFLDTGDFSFNYGDQMSIKESEAMLRLWTPINQADLNSESQLTLIPTDVNITGNLSIGDTQFVAVMLKSQTDETYTIQLESKDNEESASSFPFQTVRDYIMPNMGLNLEQKFIILPLEDKDSNVVIESCGLKDLSLQSPSGWFSYAPFPMYQFYGKTSVFEQGDTETQILLGNFNGNVVSNIHVVFDMTPEHHDDHAKLGQIFSIQQTSKFKEGFPAIESFDIQQLQLIFTTTDQKLDRLHFVKKRNIFASESAWSYGLTVRMFMRLKTLCSNFLFCNVYRRYADLNSIDPSYEIPMEGNYKHSLLELSSPLRDTALSERFTLIDPKFNMRINTTAESFQGFFSGKLSGSIEKGREFEMQAVIKNYFTESGLKLEASTLEGYGNAFGFNEMLDINQIQLQGKLDGLGRLKYYKFNTLAVYGGPQCYDDEEPVQDKLLLANENCAYGNLRIAEGGNRTHVEGQFNLKDLEQLISLLYENYEFEEAYKNIKYPYGQVFNYTSNSSYYSFSGSTSFLGIKSTSHTHISKDKLTFNFTTNLTSFSLGQQVRMINFNDLVDPFNVLGYELNSCNYQYIVNESINNTNLTSEIVANIQILNEEQESLYIQGMVDVFNALAFGEIRIRDQQFKLKIDDIKVNNGLFHAKMNIKLPFQDDLTKLHSGQLEASFNTKSLGMQRVEIQVNEMLFEWHDTNIISLSRLQAVYDIYSSFIEQWGSHNLCRANECPQVAECVSAPVYTCIEYVQTQSCIRHDKVCSMVEEKCKQTQDVCQIKIEGQCVSTVTKCVEWSAECVGEEQDVCKEFSLEDQPDQCTKFVKKCKQGFVDDAICKARCNELESFYEQQKLMKQRLGEQIDLVKKLNQVLENLRTSINQGDNYLFKLNTISFQVKNMDETFIIEDGQIPVDYDIQLIYEASSSERVKFSALIDLHSISRSADIIFENVRTKIEEKFKIEKEVHLLQNFEESLIFLFKNSSAEALHLEASSVEEGEEGYEEKEEDEAELDDYETAEELEGKEQCRDFEQFLDGLDSLFQNSKDRLKDLHKLSPNLDSTSQGGQGFSPLDKKDMSLGNDATGPQEEPEVKEIKSELSEGQPGSLKGYTYDFREEIAQEANDEKEKEATKLTTSTSTSVVVGSK